MNTPHHKNSSARRSFIRNASLTVMGLLLLSRSRARKNARRTVTTSCAPQVTALTGTITSVRSGQWSDAATWGGKTPVSSDTPLIATGHTVIFDVANTTVAGINVNKGAALQFHNLTSVTLQSTRNIVIEGILQMRPNSATVVHTLRFTGIEEDKFVGGGMDVLTTDIGLWVMGAGRLDIAGSAKTSWLKAGGPASAGATGIALETTPKNWKEHDEIVLTPTEPPVEGSDVFLKGFDHAKITGITGRKVSLDTRLIHSHPKVNDQWTAEVMNLTRNVRIEGTEKGKAHIFIRSATPQTIKYAAIRYMGPRKDRSGDGVTELVAGRYGIHFHHCQDGSRGSQVEGNVIRDTGNHSYVPHVSHGITLTDNIAYNITEMAFWWDPGDPTHDCIYDHNIVGLCKFVPRSKDMNAEDAPTFSSSGFAMNSGDGNICRNNVVVGTIGDPELGGGYNWEAVLNEGVWSFTNNLAHNCNCGIRIWQNTSLYHTIEDFTGYHNGIGIFHGAYANRYNYNGGYLYGNGLEIKAASLDSNRVRFENMTIDGAGLIDYCIRVVESPLDGEVPVFLRNLTLKGHRKAAIANESPDKLKSIDVIACDIAGTQFYMQNGISPKEEIRVQPLHGNSFSIKRADQGGDMVKEWNGRRKHIEAFAPTLWGNGKGLRGEYYNGDNFNSPAFKRIDPNISFYDWSNGIHHALTGNKYSIRWTGKVQPQYSETYTFILGSGGGHRLWIDGKLLIDSWEEHALDPGGYKSQPIVFQAGKKYDIRLEFFNNNNRTGIGLAWESKSLSLEYIPQSQLYTEV